LLLLSSFFFFKKPQQKMTQDKADYTVVKVLLVGNANTGKSQLLQRFAEETFSPAYISTIGVDFKIRTLDHQGRRLKLQIWDTAGQERFRTITTSYYRGAHVVVLCYSVGDPESAMALKEKLKEVEEYASSNVGIVVAGLQSDEPHDPSATQMVDEFCEEHNLGEPMICSAKDGVGINDVFEAVMDKYLAVHESGTSFVPQKKKKSRKTGNGFFGVGKFF
jgi:small GTP-binding protein